MRGQDLPDIRTVRPPGTGSPRIPVKAQFPTTSTEAAPPPQPPTRPSPEQVGAEEVAVLRETLVLTDVGRRLGHGAQRGTCPDPAAAGPPRPPALPGRQRPATGKDRDPARLPRAPDHPTSPAHSCLLFRLERPAHGAQRRPVAPPTEFSRSSQKPRPQLPPVPPSTPRPQPPPVPRDAPPTAADRLLAPPTAAVAPPRIFSSPRPRGLLGLEVGRGARRRSKAGGSPRRGPSEWASDPCRSESFL